MQTPTTNGQVLEYDAVSPRNDDPRIYYVNGIQTDGEAHAKTATALSVITERVIYGVFNATAGTSKRGFAVDLLQCGADWTDVFLSKVAEIGNIGVSGVVNSVTNFVRGQRGLPPGDPVSVANEIRKAVPQAQREVFIERSLGTYNRATESLFRQLRSNLGRLQYIVAHSQGNLITADALWGLTIAYGEMSLANLRVYSLASSAPAWPLGIRGHRRKVYGHTNDLVTLCDPHNWAFITSRVADGNFGRTAGDWRQYGPTDKLGLEGHEVGRNIALNFTRSIRRDLRSPDPQPAAPQAASPALQPARGSKSYVVKPGDSLSKIAASIYGDAQAWRKIYEANRVTVGPNPDRIFPGQHLTLP